MKQLLLVLIFAITLLPPAARAVQPASPEEQPLNEEIVSDDGYYEEEPVTEEEAIDDLNARLRKAQESEAGNVAPPQDVKIEDAATVAGAQNAQAALPAEPAQAVITPAAPSAPVEKKGKYNKPKHDWSFKNGKNAASDAPQSESATTPTGMKKY